MMCSIHTQLTLGLIGIVLLPTADSQLALDVTPKNSWIQVGDKLVLTCSASKCSDVVKFNWRSVGDIPFNGQTQTKDSASQLTYNPVGVMSQQKVLCSATCGDDRINQAQNSATINVYALPEPIISGNEFLTEGQDSDLTCTVPDSFPAHHLRVQWLLGDKVMVKDIDLASEEDVAQTVTSVLKYKPTAQDHGQNVTCRATLDIEPKPEPRETVASMAVRSSPRFLSVEVSPSVEVDEGQNVSLRIRALGFPRPSVTLIRLQDNVEVHSADGTFNLIGVGPGQRGQYLLHLTNEVGHQSRNFSLGVRSKTVSWNDPKTVAIPAVSFVSIATAAGFLIRFLRRAKANSLEISRVI